MINVLIVDDIADNREMLEKLVQRFGQKHEISCKVFHAENGRVAVDLCQEHKMDLVFMDVVMPIMDGLEATQKIKQISASSMIVVISSENDELLMSKILQAGAEDYILKPFSSAIMLSRLHNYYRLIGSRHSIGFQSTAVNTFTYNVYSYHMRFFISNEDELAQFWETLLVRFEYQSQMQQLSDAVRFLYYLGSYQVKKSYKCHIYVEEDEDNFYISMDRMKLLSPETIQKALEKFGSFARYKIEDDLLSFALKRIEKRIEKQADNVSSKSLDSALKQETTEPKVSAVTRKAEDKAVATKKATLRTYELLDEEDQFEFEHILAKLQTEISLMGSSSLQIDDVDTIHEYFKQLIDILSSIPDAYGIADALRDFSALLEDHSEEFLARSQELAQTVKSFVGDLVRWKEMLFYTGAPSVDFLDQSIMSNVQMIRALFVQENQGLEELDGIFDF